MGVEPAGDDPVSAIVAGPYGGNLVLRELTVGSSLYLPVQKAGGRVWMGDVHALQGDGVVDQTAIETAAEDLQIRYVLHKGVDAGRARWPRPRPTGSASASPTTSTTPSSPASESSSPGSMPPRVSPRARPTPCAPWRPASG